MHRILIVDDEHEICRILSEYLKLKGFETVVAYSGEDALKILKKKNIDLMILDIRMPDIDGVGVLKELRKYDEKLPVIVLTGSQILSEHESEMSALKYNELLVKPVEFSKLLEKINALL
jgi:two-component system, OmpR family, response regulator ResD